MTEQVGNLRDSQGRVDHELQRALAAHVVEERREREAVGLERSVPGRIPRFPGRHDEIRHGAGQVHGERRVPRQ